MMRWLSVVIVFAVSTASCSGAAGDRSTVKIVDGSFQREEPFVVRQFRPFVGDRWIGNGVSFSPFRDGQRPGVKHPDKEEIRADVLQTSKYWQLIRMYSSDDVAEHTLQVIREEGLEMRVMLGVWIAPEQRLDKEGNVVEVIPVNRVQNRDQIETAVRLCETFPELIAAVAVGNETQVFWTGHRSPLATLIEYVREIRARCTRPTTVCDDFNFWNKPEAQSLARELDFVVTHYHPAWNGVQLEDALRMTQATLASIVALHPDRLVILGETGWPTQRSDHGEQAQLIKGRLGEAEQAEFFEAFNQWINTTQTTAFYFEVFDENWKGGEDPAEVEKHWGVIRADRSPKAALVKSSPKKEF